LDLANGQSDKIKIKNTFIDKDEDCINSADRLLNDILKNKKPQIQDRAVIVKINQIKVLDLLFLLNKLSADKKVQAISDHIAELDTEVDDHKIFYSKLLQIFSSIVHMKKITDLVNIPPPTF